MGSVLSSRRLGALAVFALLAALVAVWVGRQYANRDTFDPDAEVGPGDSRRPAVRVGEGLAKQIEALGHSAHSWNGSAHDLAEAAGAPELAKAAFLMAPAPALSGEEAAALLDWVDAGGTLFVAPSGCPALEQAVSRWVELVTDDTDASAIPGDRMVPHENGPWRYREVTGEERVEFSTEIREVAIPGPMRVADPSRENSILFPREGLGFVAEIVVGDGNLIVLPEPGLFSDEGLSSGSNGALLASLVADWVPPAAAVWIQR